MTDIDTLAQQQAAGLRALADMIETNPELAKNFSSTLNRVGINVHLSWKDRVAELARIARIAKRHGATVTKDINETFHNLVLDFGGTKAQVLAYRSEVCERVVTGTETVTKRVKDPTALAAVPEVEVTETVEKFEWVCRPLLAADAEAVSA
ncbi:hypothetical protein [Saccharopolyspora sp. NPDC050642]|uniref:hypothetical protein n=1 Tax=Saccharopolyspora sp. NPDC050642 TaxID=3157099 RepID=UPI0033F8501D